MQVHFIAMYKKITNLENPEIRGIPLRRTTFWGDVRWRLYKSRLDKSILQIDI